MTKVGCRYGYVTSFEATPVVHLNSRALAMRWGVTVGHLANLRCAGRGPNYLRLGSRIAYRLDDVEAYETACLVQPLIGA